jgi:hypothetical protein
MKISKIKVLLWGNRRAKRAQNTEIKVRILILDVPTSQKSK